MSNYLQHDQGFSEGYNYNTRWDCNVVPKVMGERVPGIKIMLNNNIKIDNNHRKLFASFEPKFKQIVLDFSVSESEANASATKIGCSRHMIVLSYSSFPWLKDIDILFKSFDIFKYPDSSSKYYIDISKSVPYTVRTDNTTVSKNYKVLKTVVEQDTAKGEIMKVDKSENVKEEIMKVDKSDNVKEETLNKELIRVTIRMVPDHGCDSIYLGNGLYIPVIGGRATIALYCSSFSASTKFRDGKIISELWWIDPDDKLITIEYFGTIYVYREVELCNDNIL